MTPIFSYMSSYRIVTHSLKNYGDHDNHKILIMLTYPHQINFY